MNFEKSLGRYVGRLHYLLTKRLNELLEQANANITADQFRLLTHLWKKDGLNQQNLATYLSRDRAGVTRMIDILENQHFITRIANQDDRRVNLIYLTKQGRELEPLAAECAKKCLDEMTSGFNDEEREIFASLLLKAIENLKTEI
ncbi:MAG: MarR family transcriptional regulator [Cytophagales bacterium]|nr:MAG: MarR family transcriptional regulator [Cytophagales bacterium]